MSAFSSEARCIYHPHEPAFGVCSDCKEAFCASCAVAYPGHERPSLCLNCGAALFAKWWRRAFVFALCGALLGMWLPARSHFSFQKIGLMSAASGYGAWALSYGWRLGNGAWTRCYEFLRKVLRHAGPCLAILVLMRIPAALLLGACGGGLRLSWRTLQLLRAKHRLAGA